MEMLRALEGNPNQSRVAADFGVSRSVVNRTLKNREEILRRSSSYNSDRKRKRNCKEAAIDEALFVWFQHKLALGARLSGPLMKEKARQLAAELGREFEPSDGWFNRFKARHSIALRRDRAETPRLGQRAVPESAERRRASVLPELLRQFPPDDVFTADEAALFPRGFVDRGLATTAEAPCGRKRARKRVTVLECVNASRSEKRPLVVLGKSEKRRNASNDLSQLPALYRSSASAWMSAAVLDEHLLSWDGELRHSRRKIALLLDGGSLRQTDLHLTNIKLVFLPPPPPSLVVHVRPADPGVGGETTGDSHDVPVPNDPAAEELKGCDDADVKTSEEFCDAEDLAAACAGKEPKCEWDEQPDAGEDDNDDDDDADDKDEALPLPSDAETQNALSILRRFMCHRGLTSSDSFAAIELEFTRAISNSNAQSQSGSFPKR
ncbi:tigger transposable element-derived protein 6-like [Lethenteron reissneri]|uniref:tigger transposable element-derived protein 6-like n=1 Tax=Lethenteron reissneri TaxID=7753 RepID=UPI002AB6C668|nr:tigger transposable element-derived protein 6-like [Lethenteron reissneri]